MTIDILKNTIIPPPATLHNISVWNPDGVLDAGGVVPQISVRISGITNVRNAKANVRKEKKEASRATKMQLARPEIRMLRSMDFSASTSRKRPRRFFLLSNRQTRWIFSGTRSSLLMPLSFGRSELLTSKISKTKQSSASRRNWATWLVRSGKYSRHGTNRTIF